MSKLSILIVNNQEAAPLGGKRSPGQDAYQLHSVVDSILKAKKLGKATTVDSSIALSISELSSFDGVILSGSPRDLLDRHVLGHMRLNTQVLLSAKVPIYGICGGFQILSQVFGASLDEFDYEHSTKVRVDLRKDRLFRKVKKSIRVQEYHTQYVVAPPPGFRLIATCARLDECKVQGIRHKNRPIWGTQFHPEYSYNQKSDHGKQILENFVHICREH